MIHFDTYNVHIYKPVTKPWSEAQEEQSMRLIKDADLCALLEAVTTLYLQQRDPQLAADLVVGATLHNAEEMTGYRMPLLTADLGDGDVRQTLHRMLAVLALADAHEAEELERMAATREREDPES